MKLQYLIILFWILFVIGNLYIFYVFTSDYNQLHNRYNDIYNTKNIDEYIDYEDDGEDINDSIEGWRGCGPGCQRRRRRQRQQAAARAAAERAAAAAYQRMIKRRRREQQERLRRIREAQEAERRRQEAERRRIEAARKLALLKEERLQKYMEMFLKSFNLENKKYSTQNEMADFLKSEEGLGNTIYYEDPKNNISKSLSFNKDLFISFFTTIRNTDFDYDIDIMKFKINIPENYKGRCLGFNGIYYCGNQNIFSKEYIPSKETTITISSEKSNFKGKWKFYGTQKPFLGHIIKSIYLSYFPCNINNKLYYFKRETL